MKARSAIASPLLAALALAAALLFVTDLAFGSVRIPFAGVIDALAGRSADRAWTSIVLVFRLPKALTALVAGAALAVSGADPANDIPQSPRGARFPRNRRPRERRSRPRRNP